LPAGLVTSQSADAVAEAAASGDGIAQTGSIPANRRAAYFPASHKAAQNAKAAKERTIS
jgi:hypothetical protein